MPQVPTYDSFQVAPEAVPVERIADVRPGDSALQVGSGLNAVGAAATEQAIALQHQQNADRVFQAEAKVKDSYLQFEQGVKQKRGQDAWGIGQLTAKWWQDNLKDASDGLENDEQRRVFGQSIDAVRRSSVDNVASYELEQRRVSTEQSATASINSSINLAAASPLDRNAVMGAKNAIVKRVQVLSDLNGYTPEVRDAVEAEHLTNLHKQVIQSLIDTNPTAAKTYFDANKSEINGADRDVIDKALRVGTVREIGQQGSEKIMGMGLGESGALARARKDYEGEAQDEVVRRVKERYADIDRERERGQAAAADQAWQIWSKNKSLSAVPTSVLNSMDGKVRTALEAEDAAHASGADIRTDWGTFYSLRAQAANDPKSFAGTDIRGYFDKLNPSQREQLIDLQNQVKTGANNDLQTLNQQLEQAHQQLGWSASDGEKKGAFDAAALGALDAAQKANGGKKLGYDDRQKIVDRMMVQGSYPGGSWFSTDRFYQVSGKQAEGQFAPKIPDEDLAQIKSALTRKGMPTTDENVQWLYKTTKGLP